MVLLCNCRYSTPKSFPSDCVSVFDSVACKYIVHKRDDPSVLCPIYGAVGKWLCCEALFYFCFLLSLNGGGTSVIPLWLPTRKHWLLCRCVKEGSTATGNWNENTAKNKLSLQLIDEIPIWSWFTYLWITLCLKEDYVWCKKHNIPLPF